MAFQRPRPNTTLVDNSITSPLDGSNASCLPVYVVLLPYYSLLSRTATIKSKKCKSDPIIPWLRTLLWLPVVVRITAPKMSRSQALKLVNIVTLHAKGLCS